MKKLISNFSDKLLSNQQLKTVKGSGYYCFCGGGGAPVDAANAGACNQLCGGPTGGPGTPSGGFNPIFYTGPNPWGGN